MKAPSAAPHRRSPARRAMPAADEGAASGPSGPRPKARRHKRSRRLIVVAAVLVLGLLAGVGYFGVKAVRALDRIERDDSLIADYPGRPEPGSGINFLVLASHTDTSASGADLIMLLHLNQARNKVFLISLPRDLTLTDPQGRGRTLQQIYADTKASGLVRAVETSLDARIDHVARVDYKGFIGLTSQLGGVVVDNPYATTTPAGLHFPKGEVTVAGDDALAYVADNSSIPDRERVLAERQQSVLRAIVLKILQPSTFLNPPVLVSVLQALAKHVTVDSGMTTSNILQLASSLRLSHSSDIVAAQPPVLGTTTGSDGNPAALPSPTMITELSNALRHDQMDQYQAAHPS